MCHFARWRRPHKSFKQLGEPMSLLKKYIFANVRHLNSIIALHTKQIHMHNPCVNTHRSNCADPSELQDTLRLRISELQDTSVVEFVHIAHAHAYTGSNTPASCRLFFGFSRSFDVAHAGHIHILSPIILFIGVFPLRNKFVHV